MNQRNAAMGLASLGRGPDSSLVHMSPREIQALQQLAVQNGGSLTINPETGLPEAGFLSDLLPAIVGIGLAGVTGGASLGVLGKMTALKAGLLMGGGALLASKGDWRQAAKWGLGGYGGAALGSGLAGAGAAPIQSGPTNAIIPGLGSQTVPTIQQAAAMRTAAASGLTTGGSLAPSLAQSATTVAQAPVTLGNMGRGFTNLATGAKGAGANFAAGVQGASPFGLGVKTAGLAALAPAYLREPEPLEKVDVPGTEEVAYPAYAPLDRQALAVRNVPYSVEDSSEQDWFSEPNYRAYDPNVDPWNANYQSGVATAAQGGIVSLQNGGIVPFQNGGDVGEESYFSDDEQSYFPDRDFSTDFISHPSQITSARNADGTLKWPGSFSPMGSGSGFTPEFLAHIQTIQGGGSNYTGPISRTYTDPADPYKIGEGEQSYFDYRYADDTPSATATDATNTDATNTDGSGNSGVSTLADRRTGMGWGGSNSSRARQLRAPTPTPTPTPTTSNRRAVPAGAGFSPMGSGSGFNVYAGGIIPQYAAGGLTAGPGDGMSDEIMTTIAGRRRAALSPGEFVVPADVVSGIGNGDTNSGAKRLYAMMDGIRDGRTGKTTQPQRINPRLPA